MNNSNDPRKALRKAKRESIFCWILLAAVIVAGAVAIYATVRATKLAEQNRMDEYAKEMEFLHSEYGLDLRTIVDMNTTTPSELQIAYQHLLYDNNRVMIISGWKHSQAKTPFYSLGKDYSGEFKPGKINGVWNKLAWQAVLKPGDIMLVTEQNYFNVANGSKHLPMPSTKGPQLTATIFRYNPNGKIQIVKTTLAEEK